MTGQQHRPNSRGGPVGSHGARTGADGVHAAVQPRTDPASPPPATGGDGGEARGEPRPVEEGEQYVRITDFEAVVGERDEFRADLQRMAADFENFRRRAAREREQVAAAADAKLLAELLVVVDDLQRARAQIDAAGTSDGAVARLGTGVRMVHERLDGVLRTHGLEPIEVAGHFDPALHEAMMVQPAAGVDDGMILTVLQGGWRLGDRVVRHARVVVAGEA